jgi:hypothetical protein
MYLAPDGGRPPRASVEIVAADRPLGKRPFQPVAALNPLIHHPKK